MDYHGDASHACPPSQTIVLTLAAQEYGLTVEDLMTRLGCTRDKIIVEQPK